MLNHNSHKVLLWRFANLNLVFVQVDEEDVDIECRQASTDVNLRDGICKVSSLLVRESRRVGINFLGRHFGDNALGQVSRSSDDQIIMSAGEEIYITRLCYMWSCRCKISAVASSSLALMLCYT